MQGNLYQVYSATLLASKYFILYNRTSEVPCAARVFRGFSIVFLSRSRFLPRLLSRSRSLSLPACLPLPLPVTAPEKLNSTVFVNHICTHLPKATNTSKHHTCPLCQIWHRSFNTKGPRFKDTYASSNQQVCRRHGCNIQQFYSSHTVNKTTGQEITSRS